ncbi:MAG: MATE family efflux transporter [Eubacteriales bacterium]|nr:MATE family efflux transporter [Eubacteriales bacterium]
MLYWSVWHPASGRTIFLRVNFKMANAKPTTLMTEGPIWKKIVTFALPLFLGNLFQQLYNTADSLIVGNFLGSDALAAVSSSGSLIFLMVGFFNGIAMGAGVVVARYFGARQAEKLHRAIHTDVAFGLAAGVLLTIIGLLLAPQMLVWMGTPEDVMPNSVLYFRIYFSGSLAFVLYNVLVGILQSVGDSRHPLNYLILSSLVNIGLDLLFVGVLGLGVGSAAFATIVSQFISAFLCLRRLMKTDAEYRIVLSKIRFDLPMLRQITENGLPAGLQNSIIALANVVVQSNINSFGKMAVAGCGAYSKVEGFGFLPITCFSLALTTFISQNLGARQYDRAKEGARFGIVCSIFLAELVGVCIYLLSPVLIAAFNSDPAVVAFGVSQARTVTLFYFLLAFSHCIAGIMRGAGKATVPMFVMLCCWCIIRVTYVTVAVRFFPVITTVFWAYPLTWSLSSLLFLIYFLKADWIHGFEKQR